MKSEADEVEKKEVDQEEEEEEYLAGLYDQVRVANCRISASRAHLMRPPLPRSTLDRTPM
jgi:hypothetical protein